MRTWRQEWVTLAFVGLVSAASLGCARVPFDNLGGMDLPDSEVARLDQAECLFCVKYIREPMDSPVTVPVFDETRDHSRDPFRLKPGQYMIVLVYQVGKLRPVRVVGTLTLQPGHEYLVKGPKVWIPAGLTPQKIWMEDKATGEVVLGEKP